MIRRAVGASLRSPSCAGLLLIAGATACGFDEDSDGTTSAVPAIRSIPDEEFVKQGNELCTSNSEAVASTLMSMSEPPTPAELTAAYDNMIEESYKITCDLLALGAPSGRGKEFIDLIVEMHEVTSRVEEQGQEAFFASQDDPWKPAVDKLVGDFGLVACEQDKPMTVGGPFVVGRPRTGSGLPSVGQQCGCCVLPSPPAMM